jgi:hypothetical protein
MIEQVKHSEKSFNSNGYKTLKIMAFQDAAVPTSKLSIGTVIGILNPKLMKPQAPVQPGLGAA